LHPKLNIHSAVNDKFVRFCGALNAVCKFKG